MRTDTIGRIPTISLSPRQAELYYLRMLLHHRPGATSFTDLRTIDGITYDSFQDCCNKLGLLDDDSEKDTAMLEATAIRFGPQLRLAFATILIYCRPADPLAFWERHKLELCRDFMMRDKLSDLNHYLENQALIHLQEILDNEGLDLNRDFKLPSAEAVQTTDGLPKVVHEEMQHDCEILKEQVQVGYPKLTQEQKHVFDTALKSVEEQKGQILALDASGGTGKTHTINLILAAVRSKKKIAIATALSGIAATLLTNGRTLHSRCKVPLNINETSMCSISPKEAIGVLFQRADLLIIDEISMGHKHVFEAIDRTMQDLRKISSPFGGLTVILAGDWRQILPVVRHGSRPDIVEATLKASYLWQFVTKLKLTQNMRAKLREESSHFAEYLLSIGNGQEEQYEDKGKFFVKVPEDIAVTNERELLGFVFGGLNENYKNSTWLASRSVICPTNSEVDNINKIIMDVFPGEEKIYRSHDTVEENEHQYPVEFLNTLCPSGMPPHKLHLKKHSVIMLLRNLDPVNGHCNGTRYVVEHLHDHIIDATIACGPHSGKRIFIPRIPIIPSDNIFPFNMKRKQFPVRPAFAITANKAQGQTLQQVGIYLKNHFFSHGQLYVAMSRVGSKESLRILSEARDENAVFASNVVFKEILQS